MAFAFWNTVLSYFYETPSENDSKSVPSVRRNSHIDPSSRPPYDHFTYGPGTTYVDISLPNMTIRAASTGIRRPRKREAIPMEMWSGKEAEAAVKKVLKASSPTAMTLSANEDFRDGVNENDDHGGLVTSDNEHGRLEK